MTTRNENIVPDVADFETACAIMADIAGHAPWSAYHRALAQWVATIRSNERLIPHAPDGLSHAVGIPPSRAQIESLEYLRNPNSRFPAAFKRWVDDATLHTGTVMRDIRGAWHVVYRSYYGSTGTYGQPYVAIYPDTVSLLADGWIVD
jgi:hypothetical protein